MIEFTVVFMSGLLGSGHCLGMCGAFAMAVGWNCRTAAENFKRQLWFSIGRATTYVFLGAIVGCLGQGLMLKTSWLGSTQGLLSILSGVLLLLAGLASAGWLPLSWSWLGRANVCSATKTFRDLLRSRRSWDVLIAGLLTGFLPCGLVYGALLVAASQGDVLRGILVMVFFATGTLPLMLAAGSGASLLSVVTRVRLLRAAGMCVIVMGALTIARGAMLFGGSEHESHARCPWCDSTHDD